MSSYPTVSGLEIRGAMNPGYAEILTPEACAFLAGLFEKFGPRRLELLAKRAERQQAIDAGQLPDFLPETAAIRGGDWKVAPIPPDLLDRRTEITGPVDRKMAINALNSGGAVLDGRFRGRQLTDMGKRHGRPGQHARRRPADHRLHFARGEKVCVEGQDCRHRRPPARLAHGGETHPFPRRARVGVAFRLGPVLLPQRQGADRAWLRSLLLPAQAREPPRSPALERRVRPRPGRPRHPARYGSRHNADRDDHRRVRSRGNSL